MASELGAVFVDIEHHCIVLAGDALRQTLQDFVLDFFGVQLDERHVDFVGVELGQFFSVNRLFLITKSCSGFFLCVFLLAQAH